MSEEQGVLSLLLLSLGLCHHAGLHGGHAHLTLVNAFFPKSQYTRLYELICVFTKLGWRAFIKTLLRGSLLAGLSADCGCVCGCSVSVHSDGAGCSRFPVRVSVLWATGYRTLCWNAVVVNKTDGVWPECTVAETGPVVSWSPGPSGEPPLAQFD